MSDPRVWEERLRDRRGRRVVFLAHCLLNENTRYLGGACTGGPVREVLQPCLDHGVGIVQLPCPEQHAWGGVLKRRLLLFYGAEGTLRDRLRPVLLPLLLWYTRRIFRRLAREAAAQVEDYRNAGFTVLGVVGVDGSPSCGVRTTLDVKESLAAVGRLREGAATAREMNDIVRGCAVPGTGLFIALLGEELKRRGVSVPFLAQDLLAELDGRPSAVDIGALLGDKA
jgi:predicted secreted protein